MADTLNDLIKRYNKAHPEWTDAEVKEFAQRMYNSQQAANSKPTPKPSTSANMGPVNTGASAIPTPKASGSPKASATPSPTATVKDTVNDTTLRKIPAGVQTDWQRFVNGGITLNPAGTAKGGVQSETYVTIGGVAGDPTPNAVALFASPDGKGYTMISLDQAVRDALAAIPAAQRAYVKKQLQPYYPNTKAFQTSMTQPVTERDLGLEAAVRKAITTVSEENFYKGQAAGNWLKDNPSSAKTFVSDLFTFNTFVQTRNPVPVSESVSARESSLTTKLDAINEFKRTVQQYVGEPTLVDNVDKLAEEYYNRLHAEEVKRISTSYRTTDPITGKTTASGTSWAPLSEQDRVEMRLGLVVNGATVTDAKTKQKIVLSTGLKNATQEALADASGLIGQGYSKLNSIAADYGIQLTHEDLLSRVNRALKPGGVTTGVSPDTLATGLSAEENSIKQAAKVHFKTLAPYIDQGLKVSDISSNFQRLKENEFGYGQNTVSVYDPDVQKAISGDKIYGVNDFINTVRTDPAWRKTAKANELAAQWVNTLLKSWGKVG